MKLSERNVVISKMTKSLDGAGYMPIDLTDESFGETAEGIRALHRALVAADDAAYILQTLAICFRNRPSQPDGRHYYYEALCDVAVRNGSPGIDLLTSVIKDNPSPTQRTIALRCLWSVANHKVSLLSLPNLEPAVVSASDAAYAYSGVGDLMIVALTDEQMLTILFQTSQFLFKGNDESTLATYFIKTVSESAIVLTESMIDEFTALLASELPEATYQNWLTSHPVFIDPLAAEIIPLAPLGLEYKTDYVLRRHDGRYVVIEIEKPQDKMFTKSNDLTADFTHAVGQVLDFQHWLAQNTAYAQRRFPGIRTPAGIVVTGMRHSLSERQADKLERWQINSSMIEVLTFDDLAVRARHLLRSLRGGSADS